MQREILFRGIREDNGEWVAGDLSHTNQGKPVIQKWIIGKDDRQELLYYLVKPETVGQSIGSTYTKGKIKIFEGDILGYGDNYPCLVKYDPVICQWIAEEHGNDDGIRNHEIRAYTTPWTILGTIHQNPELLKKD